MNRLKILRKARNISQSDIAAQLGIKPAAISKYETGRVPLTEYSIEKICRLLHVSADELLGLTPPAASSPSVNSRIAGSVCPASVTLEDYLCILINTIAHQKKQMDQTIRNLHSCGIPAVTISRVTAIREEDIIKLLESPK